MTLFQSPSAQTYNSLPSAHKNGPTCAYSDLTMPVSQNEVMAALIAKPLLRYTRIGNCPSDNGRRPFGDFENLCGTLRVQAPVESRDGATMFEWSASDIRFHVL
jgi:hypothetical protein